MWNVRRIVGDRIAKVHRLTLGPDIRRPSTKLCSTVQEEGSDGGGAARLANWMIGLNVVFGIRRDGNG